MTVLHSTAQITSSSLQMTQQWWGLITNNDESEYREEVQHLVDWCQNNNLSLYVQKTKEVAVNFRKSSMAHTPLHINGSAVEMVNSVKFLGVHISADLSWNLNTTTIMKKAQQRFHFLRKLKKASLLLSSHHFTREPLRASSAATSLSGTGTAPSLKSSLCSEDSREDHWRPSRIHLPTL